MKHPLLYQTFLAALLALLFPLSGQADNVAYSYDDAGRLIGAYFSDGRTVSYVYDANGNLLRQNTTQFSDSDTDGMDDAWEQNHFGNLSRNGAGDFDGDGQSDLNEFMAGTDPKDPQSVLKVVQVDAAAGVSFTVHWSAVPGKYYRVQYNDTLSPGGWHNLGGDIQATTGSASKVDDTVAGGTKRFYRVLALF